MESIGYIKKLVVLYGIYWVYKEACNVLTIHGA